MAITVCQCPISTVIASVVTNIDACRVEFGQIQKAIFWRRGNAMNAVASAVSSSAWTARLTATGDKKAVVTPFMTLVIPASEPRTVGSGNEVINGVPIQLGTNSVKAEGHVWETDQATIRKLKALSCEVLDVLFINENNQLIYNNQSSKVNGFTVQSLFVSDPSMGSFTDGTKNAVQLFMPGGWADYATLSAATTFLLDMVNS